MSDKSFVTMGAKHCLVCDEEYEDGTLLLDQRMRNRFEQRTVTGTGLCPEHNKKGFVCLIEVDENKSTLSKQDRIKPQDAYRTGRYIHIKDKAFKNIFNMSLPPNKCCFIDEAVFNKLEEMVK